MRIEKTEAVIELGCSTIEDRLQFYFWLWRGGDLVGFFIWKVVYNIEGRAIRGSWDY